MPFLCDMTTCEIFSEPHWHAIPLWSDLVLCTNLDVEADVFVSVVMRRVHFGDELAPLHTRVLSQRPGQSLEGFSKLLDGILFETRAGLQRARGWGRTVMFVKFISDPNPRRGPFYESGALLYALKWAYLSIRGDLFGQFDLSGSCSRNQSLVLQTVKNTETVAAVHGEPQMSRNTKAKNESILTVSVEIYWNVYMIKL